MRATLGRARRTVRNAARGTDTLFDGDGDEAALAEERRLMCVGMTRGRRTLVLSCARRRGRSSEQRPSRFLSEMAADFLGQRRPAPLSPRRKKRQLTLF